MMLSSGVPLDEAMERTAGLLAGSPLAAPLADCRARMEQGEPFRKAVEQAGVLSGLSAGLLSAGERAGRTDQAMEELSQRCRQEADQALEQLLGRFEYALVAALCAAVALVLLVGDAPPAGGALRGGGVAYGAQRVCPAPGIAAGPFCWRWSPWRFCWPAPQPGRAGPAGKDWNWRNSPSAARRCSVMPWRAFTPRGWIIWRNITAYPWTKAAILWITGILPPI